MAFGGERQIVEVVTVTGGDRPGTPCGGCRQRLREFSAMSVPVYATTAGGAVIALTIDAAPSRVVRSGVPRRPPELTAHARS